MGGLGGCARAWPKQNETATIKEEDSIIERKRRIYTAPLRIKRFLSTGFEWIPLMSNLDLVT